MAAKNLSIFYIVHRLPELYGTVYGNGPGSGFGMLEPALHQQNGLFRHKSPVHMHRGYGGIRDLGIEHIVKPHHTHIPGYFQPRIPELADQQKASEIINTFEEKQMLTELVQDTLSDESNTGIQVYIGNETPIQTMKDCSVVTATYELGEGMRGTIGIIGPKRMDYDKVVGTLKTITHQLDELYKKKT